MGHSKIRRRTFVKSAAAAALAPTLITRPAWSGIGRRKSPNQRKTVALIGCGKMAKDYHLPELLKQPDVQLVAVCEVDKTRRDVFQNQVNQHYSSAKQEYNGCDAGLIFAIS